MATPPRHRHIGGRRFCDADDFREDRLEVSSSVGAECARDIFPDHPSWSNKLACPSIACIVLSQLLYYADLFIEQL